MHTLLIWCIDFISIKMVVLYILVYWSEQRKFPFLEYCFKIYAVKVPKIALRAKQAQIIWIETPSVRIANVFLHVQSSFFK